MQLLFSKTKEIKTMRYCSKGKHYTNYLCTSRIWTEKHKRCCPLCYLKTYGIKSFLESIEELKECERYNQQTLIELLKIARDYAEANKL